MGTHEQSVGASNEWYTPEYVFDAMRCDFDMDVASPGGHIVHWIPAIRHMVKDSLQSEWSGCVWMNPPFGGRNGLVPWLEKFVAHGDGVCLVPDRTSAPWWQTYAPRMDLILFVGKKIKFIGQDGKLGKSPAQGTCLMSIGDRGRRALLQAQEYDLGFLLTAAKAA